MQISILKQLPRWFIRNSNRENQVSNKRRLSERAIDPIRGNSEDRIEHSKLVKKRKPTQE